MSLPERQLDALRHIATFIAEKGMSPTAADIAALMGVSKGTAEQHIQRLMLKKMAVRDDGAMRTLRLTEKGKAAYDEYIATLTVEPDGSLGNAYGANDPGAR